MTAPNAPSPSAPEPPPVAPAPPAPGVLASPAPPAPALPTAPVRLIATDLDGTLLRDDGSVSRRTVAALAAAEAAGIEVFFVTGRPARWMSAVSGHVHGHGLAICGNGAAVVDLHGSSATPAAPAATASPAANRTAATGGHRFLKIRPLERTLALDVVRLLRTAAPGTAIAVEFTGGLSHEATYPPLHRESPKRVAPAEELLATGAGRDIGGDVRGDIGRDIEGDAGDRGGSGDGSGHRFASGAASGTGDGTAAGSGGEVGTAAGSGTGVGPRSGGEPGAGIEPVLKVLAYHPVLAPDDFLTLARGVVGEQATITRSSPSALLEISGPGVSKASTLALCCAERGITRDEVIAFGDMPNDVDMLTWAGTSYAMAGAHPAARAAATACTGGNNDDGVAAVIERLLRFTASPPAPPAMPPGPPPSPSRA